MNLWTMVERNGTNSQSVRTLSFEETPVHSKKMTLYFSNYFTFSLLHFILLWLQTVTAGKSIF